MLDDFRLNLLAVDPCYDSQDCVLRVVSSVRFLVAHAILDQNECCEAAHDGSEEGGRRVNIDGFVADNYIVEWLPGVERVLVDCK